MPNKKLSELTTITNANIATGDYIPLVDISEPLDVDKNKTITFGELDNRYLNDTTEVDINGLTDKATPVGADEFIIYDSAGADNKKASLTNLNAVIDHGSVAGLADDDHTQYALIAGRATGQSITGGTGASENLTLNSTSNVTKGAVIVNDNLDALSGLDVTGNITVSGTVDGRDVATDGTKLDGIEALADVTDTANVTAAGALMDSELTNITAVKALDQGVATTDSPTFASGTITGDLTVDTSTLKVDSTNDRVGIGTTSPDTDLHVFSGSAGVVTAPTFANFTLEGSGATNYLAFLNPNTSNAGLVWGDPDDNDAAWLYYDHNVDKFRAKSGGNSGLSLADDLYVYNTTGTTAKIGKFEAAIGAYTGTVLTAENTLTPASTYNLFACITDSDGDASGPFTEFVVRGDGNVGIGTSNPGRRLSVIGDKDNSQVLYVQSTAATAGQNLGVLIEAGTNSSDYPLLVRDKTGVTDYFKVRGDGNVGIGTSNPSCLLEVDSSTTSSIPTDHLVGIGSGEIGVWNTSNTGVYSAINLETRTTGASRWMIANEWQGTYVGDLVFRGRDGGTTSKEVMRLTNEGYCAIGLSAPDMSLDVYNSTSGKGIALHQSSSTNDTGIFFSANASGSTYEGQFKYNHSTDVFTWVASGATELALSSRGLGLGNSVLGGNTTAGQGHFSIQDVTIVPTGTVTGGGILYVESGALKYLGSSGTVTTLAPA